MFKFGKWITASVLGLATVIGVGLSNASTVTAQDDPYIIATDTTFAPFEFMEDGEYVGIDMDILRAIAEDQGFEFELRPMAFSAGLQALETRQVDGMIAGMGITDARKQVFDFSDPYYSAGVQFAVLEDSEIQTVEDLAGLKVAVKTGTTGSETALTISEEVGFELNYFEDSVNMYEDLKAGNSQAVIEDYPVMAYAAQVGEIPLRFIGEQEAVTDYGFAVPKGENAELLEMFNQGLANIIESGEFDEIVAKYLGEVDGVSEDDADDSEENADSEESEEDAE